VLVIHVSGTLMKADYGPFVAEFERSAMVGEKKWHRAMATLCKPFTQATVRYFDHSDAAEARMWLNEA